MKEEFKVRTGHVKQKNFNHGKRTKIQFPQAELDVQTQVEEICALENYKPPKPIKNGIILDIGANVGIASIYLSQFAKEVYSIEPNPKLFTCLENNTKDFPNIKVFNVGIGSQKGVFSMFGTDGNPAQSFIRSEYESPSTETINVNVTTIDEFVERNKIDKIDLIKIDVEGMEYHIFMSEGFNKIQSKVDMIVGETHVVDNYPPKEIIQQILKEYGFEFKFITTGPHNLTKNYSVTTPGWKKSVTIPLWTDFMAWRKE